MSAIVKKDASTPFVAALRTRSRTIDLARQGDARITVRVEIAELWDAVRVAVSPAEPVVSVKRAALDAMGMGDEHPEEFVMKLAGWEVLDEGASIESTGAKNGSIFLLTHRRRRPVR